MKKVIGGLVILAGVSVAVWFVFVKKKPTNVDTMLTEVEKEIDEVDTGTGMIIRSGTRTDGLSAQTITRSTSTSRQI